MTTIRITYKCACMQDEGSFVVRERQPGEDVVDFMERVVIEGLSADHHARNPACTSEKVEWLKMPVNPNKSLGEAP